MDVKKPLYFSFWLSLLLHMLFVIGIELYSKLLHKVTIKPKERIFEVIPYEPKNILPSQKPDKNEKFLGPKNVTTQKETMPKSKNVQKPEISKKEPQALQNQAKNESVHKEQEANFKQQSPTSVISTQNQESKTFEVKEMPKEKVLKKEPIEKEEVKDKAVKNLPGMEKLIPRSQDLLAKLPKEESINLNSGSVKGGKELIVNTKEFKYWAYLQKMKQKIELVWEYPEYARSRGIGGSLKIHFSIDKTGKIETINLVSSSGVKILDDAAIKALKDASPFPPFPETWDISKLNIDGTFIYQITVIR